MLVLPVDSLQGGLPCRSVQPPYVMVLLLAQPFLPYLREVIYENP